MRLTLPYAPRSPTSLADAVEAYLPTLGEAVREAYAVAGREPTFLSSLAAGGKSFDDFLAGLLLPAADLLSFVDFMYAGSVFRPADPLVTATFNQVRRCRCWRW